MDIKKIFGSTLTILGIVVVLYACIAFLSDGKVMRDFTHEDAALQGNTLGASETDIQILRRARELLNNSNNWNKQDNRVCDTSQYPYKWSLFCALHQASIDVDFEYRHLRPSIKAVRQAIEETSKGKKYAHLLQDFNNEAQSFDIITKVLVRAEEIINENESKLKN